MPTRKKFTFELSKEDKSDIPIDVESIWCSQDGDAWKIENIPFFISQLSLGDVVQIVQLKQDTHSIVDVLEQSRNSTLWLYIENQKANPLLQKLHEIGCGYETGVIEDNYAINIPHNIEICKVEKLLEHPDFEGHFDYIFGAIRHSAL